jgi:hypothetical protein
MPFSSGRSGCRFRPRESRSGWGMSGSSTAHCSSVISFAITIHLSVFEEEERKRSSSRLQDGGYFEMGSSFYLVASKKSVSYHNLVN